ncbi:MAG: ATP-binding protein [Thermoactinomyces sp.]
MSIGYFRKEGWMIALMMVLVPLAGEFFILPFDNNYRVSFGIPIFFIFLLLIQRTPPFMLGVLVGISVLTFRMVLGIYEEQTDVLTAIRNHGPPVVYYLVYALVFQFFKVRRFQYKPIMIGLFGVVTELLASLSEIGIRILFNAFSFEWKMFWMLLVIALIRNFFIMGILFFSVFKDRREKEDRQLLLETNLHEVKLHFDKSLDDLEEAISQAIDLRTRFKELDQNNLKERRLYQEDLLSLSIYLHEYKKDIVNIYSILNKVISQQVTPLYMDIGELCDVVVRSNRNYAELLQKHIEFSIKTDQLKPAVHTYTILSLLNNLISNSVEAIEKSGHIHVQVQRHQEWLAIRVKDNGPGIPPDKKQMIFRAGYTTKNRTNKDKFSFSGLGLAYVRREVEKREGRIYVYSDPRQRTTIFTALLPLKHLIREG